MQKPEVRTVRVWRALLDGECRLIHKSEEKLRDQLINHYYGYQPEEHHRWVIESEDLELPVSEGEAHDWGAEGGSGGVHIHWVCPHCGKTHFTDEDTDDQSPYLWFCERGFKERGQRMVLVTVKDHPTTS